MAFNAVDAANVKKMTVTDKAHFLPAAQFALAVILLCNLNILII
jgi:hypothetical protein